MRARFIYELLEPNMSLDFEFSHDPKQSYEIYCCCCKNYSLTEPIKDEPRRYRPKEASDQIEKWLCIKCRWSHRHRFMVKLTYNDLVRLEAQSLYMPGDHAIMPTLIDLLGKINMSTKITCSYFDKPKINHLTNLTGIVNDFQDITQLNYDRDQFDYISCNHALEHISDYKTAVGNLYSVLAPNGEMVLTFPINYDRGAILRVSQRNELGKIEWLRFPDYHDEFPVCWYFGTDIFEEIKTICAGAKVTFENYADEKIGIFNQGINLIRVKKPRRP